MNIVIIGAGIAAFSLVQSIRRMNATCNITVITSCNADQYYKPNLSQALSRNIPLEKLTTSKAENWAKLYEVNLYSNQRVTEIDAQEQRVYVADKDIAYDKLVLATGAEPIEIPGQARHNIYHLNSLLSYTGFRAELARYRAATIIGAGLVGCELASDLAQSGFAAHLLYPRDEPLGNLFPAAVGRYVKQALEVAGVTCSPNRKVVQIDAVETQRSLQLSDGSLLHSQIIVNCAGLKPNLQLARSAELTVNEGIVTDEYLQTSKENIFALGDCAEINGALHQYVAPIVQSAKALASTLCDAPVAVSLGAYPVTVKIQQMPLLFAMRQKVTEWQTEEVGQGMVARGMDSAGKLAAYVLAGKAQEQRQKLSAEFTCSQF